jgi:hypothetical protein
MQDSSMSIRSERKDLGRVQNHNSIQPVVQRDIILRDPRRSDHTPLLAGIRGHDCHIYDSLPEKTPSGGVRNFPEMFHMTASPMKPGQVIHPPYAVRSVGASFRSVFSWV